MARVTTPEQTRAAWAAMGPGYVLDSAGRTVWASFTSPEVRVPYIFWEASNG